MCCKGFGYACLSSLAQYAHDIYKYEIQRREEVVGRQGESAMIGERLCSSVFWAYNHLRIQMWIRTGMCVCVCVCVCCVFQVCKYTLKYTYKRLETSGNVLPCRLWRVVGWVGILLDVVGGVESALRDGCYPALTLAPTCGANRAS